MAKYFIVMSEFLISLLSFSDESNELRNKLLDFLFNFNLAIAHHNTHTL